jgi:hypothetical protein
MKDYDVEPAAAVANAVAACELTVSNRVDGRG